ncbi:hypothetical protein Tco_1119339 [Tanacetum coccineum]
MISSDSTSDLESTNGPTYIGSISSDDIVHKDIPEYMFSKSRSKNTKAFGLSASKAKPSLSSVSKAKASRSSSSKTKTSGSSPQTLIVKRPVPIKNCVFGLANGKTWDSILNKTFGVKKPTAGTGVE